MRLKPIYIASMLLSFVLAWRTMWGPWLMRDGLLYDMAMLEEECDRYRATMVDLERDIRILKGSNRQAQEHYLRDYMGYVNPKKHELIFDFDVPVTEQPNT